MLDVGACLGTPAQFARRMAFATALGLFLGLIGPFGSFGAPALERTASWVVCCCAGALILGVLLRLSERAVKRWAVPRLFARSLAVLVGSAPLALLTALVFHLVAHVRLDAGNWLLWYVEVAAIGLPTALLYLLLVPRGAPEATAPAENVTESEAVAAADAGTLFAQLPERLGTEVIALQMEDHYVRVHTPRGSALVLMPMGQAVAAMEDVDGERVHRSWWVARAAVEDAVKDGRNLRLRLTGGLEAPVARTTVARLREAGWLEPRSTVLPFPGVQAAASQAPEASARP